MGDKMERGASGRRKDWERKAGKGGGKNETERERKREPGGEAREPGGREGGSDPRGPHVQKSQRQVKGDAVQWHRAELPCTGIGGRAARGLTLGG